jgi:hypothetical protein
VRADPKEIAEDILSTVFITGSNKTEAALLSIAYGLIALCERWDGLSCVVAVPEIEEEEEEDE